MSVKLAILKSGETVISELKELVSDDKVCGYLFENPHTVHAGNSIFLSESIRDSSENEMTVTMAPWIILSKDTKIPVSPDWIVAIVEPIDNVKNMYEEKVNGKQHSVPSTEE